MRSILSTSQKRQLNIIERIYDEESISINKLSKILHVSEKTIRQDIQDLNNLIKPSQISISPILGLSLKTISEMSIESIYSLFLFNSIEFEIIEKIFFKKFLSLDTLAESLFISVSTLRRLILNINKSLHNIHFRIDPKTLDLIGNETQICNFMIHYFDEKYRDSFMIFPKIQLNVLDKLFLTFFKQEQIDINYPDLEKLRNWSMVILTRIKNGHRFSYTKEKHDKLPKKIISNLLIKSLFKAVFSITLTPDVFYQTFYYFFNTNYCKTFEQLKELSAKDDEIAEFIDALNLMLESVASNLSIELTKKEKLILDLFNADALYYGKSYILYDKNQANIESITHDYSNFYQFLKKEIAQNPFIKQKNWGRDAINTFFYMLITHWPNLAHSIENKIPVFSVAMFFNTDIEHVIMLQDRLSYYFRHRMKFTIVNSLTITDLKNSINQFDILLTNIFNLDMHNVRIIVLPLALKPCHFKIIDNAYIELVLHSE